MFKSWKAVVWRMGNLVPGCSEWTGCCCDAYQHSLLFLVGLQAADKVNVLMKELNRRLRDEQDAEYQRSLETDRERERKRAANRAEEEARQQAAQQAQDAERCAFHYLL